MGEKYFQEFGPIAFGIFPAGGYIGEKYFQEFGSISNQISYFLNKKSRSILIFNDFLKTKKMRNVRTIILAAVSRRDLCYVSENESFCFGQK